MAMRSGHLFSNGIDQRAELTIRLVSSTASRRLINYPVGYLAGLGEVRHE